MIPILYRPSETNFNSNGLGLLYDCISATCKEARNGEYEIEITYPVDGLHYSDIQTSCLIKAIPSDGESSQIFRIYYISKPLSGRIVVKAEHISYQLKHIPVSPYTATSALEALQGIAIHAEESCPFEFWSDNTTVGDFSLDVPVSARSVLGGMRGSILDVYNGEYKFDNFLVRLYAHRGQDTGVVLRYGKNITDITQEENIGETITGVMPYWAGQDEEGNQDYIDLTEKVIHSANAENFPYQRTIVLDASAEFNEKPTEAQLRQFAQKYITKTGIGIPKISIDISFVALWQTEEYKDIANLERVRLCDTVTVEFEPLGISATAKVVETDFDILKERYNKITLGDARTNLAGTIKADINATSDDILSQTVSPSFMQAAITRATNLIRGGLGGYVVFTPNADGEPQEILIMDTDDIQTAVNVIRMNRNGIGFSSTGYDGPFTSAWTIDGHFNADFITAGTINAALIKAGLLSDGQGKNYWNMQTGEFSLSANSTVGGQTVSTIADNAASSAVNGQTQQSIFNKLTNNGQTQGIYLKDGKLYLNGTYLQAGVINIKDANDVSTFYANTQTGAVHIVAKTFKLISGDTTKTIPEIANERASAAVNAQTQESIFNKLTNNGVTQGIYLDGGKIYLNFSYAHGGTLKLGSANNGNGKLEIYDANDTKIGEWKNDGLTQTKEMRMWKTVPSGMSVVTADCKMHQNESIIRWMLGSKYAGFIGTQYWPYGYDGTLSEDDLCLHVLGGTRLALGVACNSSGSAVDTDGTFKGSTEVIEISYNDNLRSGLTVFINKPIHLYSDGIVCYGGGFYNSSWSKTSGAGFYFETGNSEIAVVRGEDVKINAYNGKAYYNSVEIATESSSSIRYKHDIKPIEDADLDPHRLLDLRVVQFRWNADHPLQYEDMRDKTVPGIIAEDVEEIYPSAVIHKDGQVESWDERRLIPGMLALIQEQDKTIKKLEARLAKLEELLT